jgi:hypothetical protein
MPPRGNAQPSPVPIAWKLFGLHTIRFWIYLQPDQGRRQPD